MPFLSTIDTTIRYRTAQWVPSRTLKSYTEVLANAIRIHHRAGFKVTHIHADFEFRPILKEMQDIYGFVPNIANPNEHVPKRNATTAQSRKESELLSMIHLTMPYLALF